MTCDIHNPYLEEFEKIGGEVNFVASVQRNTLVREYAWAVPTTEAIEAIVRYSPIVEIGAGTGYWAKLVDDCGGDIIAFDALPPSLKKNPQARGQWYNIEIGGPTKAKEYSDRTLFLCWPPYNETFAQDCLDYYKGDTLIYVGEGPGGCTGDDAFHETLRREWKIVEHVDMPAWMGLHDYMTIHKRK